MQVCVCVCVCNRVCITQPCVCITQPHGPCPRGQRLQCCYQHWGNQVPSITHHSTLRGLARTINIHGVCTVYVCMYGVCMVFWAGKSSNTRCVYGDLGREITKYTVNMYGSGQPYIYTVFIRCSWQGNHQIYGHIRCTCTVVANPTY